MTKRESHDYRKYYDNLVQILTNKYITLYKGREIETNELRAIKVIHLDILKENIFFDSNEDKNVEQKLKEYIDEYINVCENMKICSNLNSVKYYEYFNDGNIFVIIMELCDCNIL